jgi:aspartokinase-like uncharacterized kinase
MWVVKLGGSLATDETLPYWLDVLSCYGGGEVVIVPGGGPFSELVMKSQGFWNFDDSSAHRMALMAMGQYGVMMTGMRPDLEPVESLQDIQKVLNRAGVPVWLPEHLLGKDHRVEHSWDVTSDSLAAWLAQQLLASHLLLVKSVQLDNGVVQIGKLIDSGVVDAAFSRYAREADCTVTVMSRYQYEFVPRLITGSAPVGTQVMGFEEAG